ncbi:glycosyltransferase [Plantibacter sp. YIM 135347]|uniref:glycosyltransferase n=1 Tax=Plantibacter sp. YIM 135347 TaxID=3423919 RepID=UPI003D3433D4
MNNRPPVASPTDAAPSTDLPTVLFVTHSAACSGAELFLLRVVTRVGRIAPFVLLGEHGPLEALLSEADIPHAVAGSGDLRSPARLPLLRATRDLISELRPAAVYTHSAKAHILAGVAGRLSGVPVISHAHDLLRGGSLSRINAAILQVAFSTIPTAIIANSRTTKRSLVASARLKTRDVIGCPVAIEQPCSTRAATDAPVFGLAGRITSWKGQWLAIEAFAAARSTGLRERAKLVLFGAALFGDDNVYEQELHALVSRLGLNAHVEFAGHQSDMVAALERCDVMLHTSITPEPFGQVVIEAMAAGRPVIAADQGGPSEIITSGFDGILFESGSSASLASAMLTLAEQPETRLNLARNARQSVARYDAAGIVAQLETALLHTIGR